MATAYFSTNTELGLVNALTQSLTLYLPNNSPTGKSIFIKDAAGNSLVSTITVRPQGTDTFEDGSIFQTLNSAYESLQLVYNSGKWYINGGTMFNTVRTSTLQALNVFTSNLSSLNTSVSTFQIWDRQTSSIGTFNSISSFLYYNGYNIGGGLRTAIPQVVNRFTFIPAILPGLTLWLDAADIGTQFLDTTGASPITATGQSVAYWKDKTNNNFYTQTTLATRPTTSFASLNGYNTLAFSGSQLLQTTVNQGLPLGSANGTYFIVSQTTNGTATPYVQGIFAFGANGGTQFGFGFNNNGVNNERYYLGTSGGGGGTIDGTNVYNTFTICSTTLSGTNSQSAAWRNGTTFSVQFGPYSLNISPTNPTYIGYESIQINNGYLTGNIAEILVYNVVFSTFQRQQIEGYLAWKWGLQAGLPASHPFKNAPPS